MSDFNKNWTENEIRKKVQQNCYLEFGWHENLKALCCVPDNMSGTRDYDELTFVVPVNWLEKYAAREFYVQDLDAWLQEQYTSEESEKVFMKALEERQIVMDDFH